MSDAVKPRTLGELRRSGYQPRTVREEVHGNLVRKLEAGEALFPGIVGYQDTVIPGRARRLSQGRCLMVPTTTTTLPRLPQHRPQRLTRRQNGVGMYRNGRSGSA